MKFKAGDKVRCVKPTMAIGVEVGGVYTVIGSNRRSEFGVHLALEEVRSTPTQDVFELVEPKPKFKLGDKVRCIDNFKYDSQLTLGKVYTVVEEDTDLRYVRIEPDHTLPVGGYKVERFELVREDAVLTPEEVFEHLRKGTKLQCHRDYRDSSGTSCSGWRDCSNPQFANILNRKWRIKPEPEVIELNGKKYREITD